MKQKEGLEEEGLVIRIISILEDLDTDDSSVNGRNKQKLQRKNNF